MSIPAADDILYRDLVADFPPPRWVISRSGTVITAREAGGTVTCRDTSAAVIRAALDRLKGERQVSAFRVMPPGGGDDPGRGRDGRRGAERSLKAPWAGPLQQEAAPRRSPGGNTRQAGIDRNPDSW